MKAIKFVILGCGILGLLSFFLPMLKVTMGEETHSFSAADVMKGVELAEQGVKKAREDLSDEIATAAPEVDKGLKDADEAIDTIKGIIAMFFIPSLLLVAIGGVATFRKKLGRLGGFGTMLFALIGIAMSGFSIAVLGDPSVKSVLGAGMALYLLLLTGIAGFVCGLLTLIKPDQGGRFG